MGLLKLSYKAQQILNQKYQISMIIIQVISIYISKRKDIDEKRYHLKIDLNERTKVELCCKLNLM